ncbi:DUF29 domain-containing protein [Crocosphaera sp. UHCC 0190]|uniref:DUF29 domain-containing protein n=1 Tax=Crocosphaera sp. UHCC 0190 TaxID=3110246 RepID=UPI002B20674B|nr:DUF29 domain-containing protein [Crocosphaera sp. UHCC 0190]MEA5508506.1 DUF29 domain-containing protein [Crocosphaera sp. UHCC 0190]
MNPIITKLSLYEQDFFLWLEDTATKLREGEFSEIDLEALTEEIEALGRSEKQELENRLEVLLAHLLKRIYIDSAYDNRGWELTIAEQRRRLRRLLKKSPSLKRYFEQVFEEIYQDALSLVKMEYKKVIFPDTWPFNSEFEAILTENFW